jgi:hypothetical protein
MWRAGIFRTSIPTYISFRTTMSMSNSLHAKPRHRKRKPAAASIPAPQRNSLHSTSSAPHATDMGLGSLALPQDIDVPLDMPTARPVSPSAFSGPAFSTFFDRGLLSKETVAALPYANTTPIQALTFEPILQGNDVLVSFSLCQTLFSCRASDAPIHSVLRAPKLAPERQWLFCSLPLNV